MGSSVCQVEVPASGDGLNSVSLVEEKKDVSVVEGYVQKVVAVLRDSGGG